jgi:predicted RNase H-like nuclease (RuvC/YqgF family)
VVALASEDLQGLIQDEAHAQPTSSRSRARRGAASSRARHLEQIILANEGKALDATADLQALSAQESRMLQVLEQLETERAQFQVQLTQLERQVASIARNDRMIELMERRQRTLDKIRSWDAVSLDQIQGRIATIRAEQEARLEVLTQDHEQVDYEAMARQELRAEGDQGL